MQKSSSPEQMGEHEPSDLSWWYKKHITPKLNISRNQQGVLFQEVNVILGRSVPEEYVGSERRTLETKQL